MKAAIQDRQTLLSLSPLDLATYLRTRGWKETRKDPQSSQWVLRRDREELEVLLPLDRQLRDYPLRIGELIRTLEIAEQRSQLQILADITAARYDVIRIRTIDDSVRDGSIPLEKALSILYNSQDLLLAAACSAIGPQPYFLGSLPEEAHHYVKGVRMGQTERGDFSLTLLAPVPPDLQAALFPGPEDDPAPFERRATRMLMQALGAVREAAAESVASGSIEPFERAVEQGVSANFCEALASLQEESGANLLEFRLSWAPSRPEREDIVPTQAHFSQDLVPVLREASRILRKQANDQSWLSPLLAEWTDPEAQWLPGLKPGQLDEARALKELAEITNRFDSLRRMAEEAFRSTQFALPNEEAHRRAMRQEVTAFRRRSP